MAIRERKKVLILDIDDITKEKLLGHGVGVSGGAMSGRIVFDLKKEIEQWKSREDQNVFDSCWGILFRMTFGRSMQRTAF